MSVVEEHFVLISKKEETVQTSENLCLLFGKYILNCQNLSEMV